MAFIILGENSNSSADFNLNLPNNLQWMEEDANQIIDNSTSSYEEVLLDVNNNSETITPAVITFAVQCLNFFNFYYLALIIILGMVGNTLNFLVFTQTHLRLRSSSYYLAALAVADLGFLLTPMVAWLNQVGIDLFNRQGFCQAMVYGSSVFSCLSVWLTVAYTFERLIAVQYPLQRASMCTVHRAKIIIVVLTLVTLCVHIYSLFTAGITEDAVNKGSRMCGLKPDYYQLMHIVNVIDTIVTLVIPLVLIVVMNALIAKNLVVFNQSFKKSNHRNSSHQSIQMTSIRLDGNASCRWHQQSARQVVDHQPIIRPLIVSAPPALDPSIECQQVMTTSFSQPPLTVSGVADQILPMQEGNNTDSALQQLPSNGGDVDEYQAAVQHTPHRYRKSASDHRGAMNHHDRLGSATVDDKLHQRNILSIRTQYSITKMLLLISTVFILLNLPSYVIRLQVFISDVIASSSSQPETSQSAWIAQQFSMLLYYTNFSINFLLYSACGSTFRHCLCRLLRDFFDPIWNRCCGCCLKLWRKGEAQVVASNNC